ncbi:MAG: hypothetical protein AVDCRST_MAG53-1174, partial [uncultured Solirubrobacteraceae bacterium]
ARQPAAWTPAGARRWAPAAARVAWASAGWALRAAGR